MPKATRPPFALQRLRAVLLHIPYYSIEPKARLAQDTGLSQNAISRIVRGKLTPSPVTVHLICKAIQRRSGVRIKPGEVFRSDPHFPTCSVCTLMGCTGCLPPEAWDERTDRLKPAWRNQKPGEWSCLAAEPTASGTTQLITIS